MLSLCRVKKKKESLESLNIYEKSAQLKKFFSDT